MSDVDPAWPDHEGDGSRIDALLADSRGGVVRVEPELLAQELALGALVVDIRPVEQRDRDGVLPGAQVVDRNVLEWRLDPSCPHRLPGSDRPDRRIVLVCNEGYSSSLAAATLRQLGLRNATDLVGGYQAWLRSPGQLSAGERPRATASGSPDQRTGTTQTAPSGTGMAKPLSSTEIEQ